MAWASPLCSALFAVGFALADRLRVHRAARRQADARPEPVPHPRVRLRQLANLLGRSRRGGLQFMLIIWLQGIWLPLHGYSFEETPLWSAIFMLPLTVGFLLAGPGVRLFLGPVRRRAFAVGGMAGRRGQLRRADGCCRPISPTGRSPRCCSSTASAPACSSRRTRTQIMNAVPAARARPGLRHARHDDQCRPGAVDRRVLQPDDRRARRAACRRSMEAGLAGAARAAGGRARRSPTCRRSRACSPPSSATTRWAS